MLFLALPLNGLSFNIGAMPGRMRRDGRPQVPQVRPRDWRIQHREACSRPGAGSGSGRRLAARCCERTSEPSHCHDKARPPCRTCSPATRNRRTGSRRRHQCGSKQTQAAADGGGDARDNDRAPRFQAPAWTGLFVFQFHSQNNRAQRKCDGVGKYDGEVFDQDPIGQPEKGPQRKNDVHSQGEITCPPGFDDSDRLRYKGYRCAGGCR